MRRPDAGHLPLLSAYQCIERACRLESPWWPLRRCSGSSAGIPDLRQVPGSRPRVQLRQDRIRTVVLLEESDFRVLSFRSPKTIACVGHACWQAVTMSPSWTAGLGVVIGVSNVGISLGNLAEWIRCTQ